jgi:class 3 adenylate cyclase
MSEELPARLANYVLRMLVEQRRMAYLQVDAQGLLRACGGALSRYGLDKLELGRAVDEQIDFLIGLLPLPEPQLVLHDVHISSDACAHIHMWSDEEGAWIVLIDATAEHDRRQAVQQKGNELSLRSEKQAQILSTHIGKSIADELLQGRWSVRGGAERRQVTILFADIRDFTPFSERNSPEMVFRTLNQYIPAMVDPIHQQQGIIDKIAGDAVMADFGLLADSTIAARQAIAAAVQIHRNVEALNRERAQAGEPCLGIGIGIATGPVAVGIIGTLERRGFTAIGHHVNFAARLQNYARAGEIIVDEDTHAALPDGSLGFRETMLSLKGFADRVRAFIRASE